MKYIFGVTKDRIKITDDIDALNPETTHHCIVATVSDLVMNIGIYGRNRTLEFDTKHRYRSFGCEMCREQDQ